MQDRPSDKVWTYNRSNVVMPDDGAPFRYSFSALKDRHNAVEVNWIDPDNGWETATELVEDTQAIARYCRNVTKMDAFGCTSRGQAHRAGLWLIKTELLETQTVDFSVGAEGLRHVPGDVIEICDDDYAGISTGGRVLAVNSQTRTLTLDREITLPSSGTTLISLVDGSGNPVSVEVQSVTDGAYSNNMAWCLWDMLTHPRYGMGKRLGAADVDKWALYVIGHYCDQSVPDGFGSTEPRITCNAWLTTQRKAWDVLSDFCSAMRCMPVWNGQTLTFVQDRPSDKVWTYNRSNVVMPDDGAPFRYSFSALKDRHNAVEVNWIDPDNGWETATELVEDTQAIARYGRNVTKMDAFGCTSRGQAHRAGLWLIKTELLETQTVDFSVGAEGLRHVPGDVIEICDDDYAGISTGGRVLAVNSQTRTLTLDREITLPSSGTTLISLVDGSGNPVSVEVQSVTDG
ncbi:hypothetical protein GUC50_24625, partial [Escherichia coli]|nr:hypothetical protein [Escherichia coli]